MPSTPEYMTTSFSPASQDVDPNKRLRLTAFLQKTQEAAEIHAALYGCGYPDLIAQNIVWVLSRVRVEMVRMPEWGEPVRLETWHKRVERIFALRDFMLYDTHNEPIVRATSAWLLMDIHTRRMLRVEYVLPHLGQVNIPRDAICALPDKLNTPKEGALQLLHSHQAVYSDIDLINHVTNTKYVEWALDQMSLKQIETMTAFQINFNLEARYGDQVDLWGYSGHEEGTQYIEGRRGEQNLFQSLCFWG